MKYKILEKFPAMIGAINDEIATMRKAKQEVVLFEGVFLKMIDDYYIYKFEIPEGIFLRIIEGVEGKHSYSCKPGCIKSQSPRRLF